MLPGAAGPKLKNKDKARVTRRMSTAKDEKEQQKPFAPPDPGATLITQKLCAYAGAVEEYGDATQWVNLRQYSAEHEQWLHDHPKTMRKFDFFRSFLEGSKVSQLLGPDPEPRVIDPLPKPPKQKQQKTIKKKMKTRVDNG